MGVRERVRVRVRIRIRIRIRVRMRMRVGTNVARPRLPNTHIAGQSPPT